MDHAGDAAALISVAVTRTIGMARPVANIAEPSLA
jgi:hypothetical protein